MRDRPLDGNINAQQNAWGIRDEAFLRTLTPRQVVNANYRFMINAGVPQGPAQQVSEDALNFIKQNYIRCP
jgi:hypothetical protein